MDFLFFIKCFFIGVSASCAVGPIFVLTFNRGALHGFFKGCATALGSALVDGIYFILGLLGALALLEKLKHFFMILDLFAGGILLAVGIITLKKHWKAQRKDRIPNESALLSMGKSFFLTIINPFIALFFMFISVQILPEGTSDLPLNYVFTGGIMVTGGSLSILSSVAFIASRIGKTINKQKLDFISWLTGVLFIVAGIYFIGDFFINAYKFFIAH